MVQTIRNQATLIVIPAAPASQRSIMLMCETETIAASIQGRLKDIDAELEATRLRLYRQAFGDGALGVTDEAFL